jgi:hypothetical protein
MEDGTRSRLETILMRLSTLALGMINDLRRLPDWEGHLRAYFHAIAWIAEELMEPIFVSGVPKGINRFQLATMQYLSRFITSRTLLLP